MTTNQQSLLIQELENQSDELLERLSNISHLWSKVLVRDEETGNYMVNVKTLHGFHFLDLSSHCYCIVGEAHGFNNDYTMDCTKCERYSQKLYLYLGIDPEYNDLFTQNLKGFVNHFEQVHGKNAKIGK